LIQHSELPGFSLGPEDNTPVGPLVLAYYGQRYVVKAPGSSFSLGIALLTSVGKELAPVSGSLPDAEYHALILEHWGKIGLTVLQEVGPDDADGNATCVG